MAAFVKRFTNSGGEVAEAGPERPASEWLTGFLRGLDPEVAGVAVGADVPAEMRPQLPEVAAAHAGAGISVAWGAVAESGSLILPSTGTRAAQLLPPVHIVWVPKGRVFARLEDALAELQQGLPAAVGLHSGPSKSADIGRTVVTGGSWAGAVYCGAGLTILEQCGASADLDHAKQSLHAISVHQMHAARTNCHGMSRPAPRAWYSLPP